MRGEKPSGFAVRPTARGWQAIVIGLLTLVVARLIGTTQLYQLAYALLALVLVAFALGFFNSRGLRYARALPSGVRLSAGSPARLDLLVSSSSRLRAPGLEVVDRLPEPRGFRIPTLRANGEEIVEAPVTFDRRGVYELGPAELRTTDPFALLRFVHRFSDRTEVVVYPKVFDLPSFSARGESVEDGSRGGLSRRGDEFAGLREYRHGDDKRHIHWKSVARTGELFVKEFSLQAPSRYAVVLDLRREGLRVPEMETEGAVSAAASTLAYLARERLPFRLVCTGREDAATGFGSDDGSYWRAMRLLATAKTDGDEEPSGALLKEKASLGEGVVLVLRTRDGDLPHAIRVLRAAGLSVNVVALAGHTYRAGREAHKKESEFAAYLGRLEAAGAAVRVLRQPEGVAGLSWAGVWEAVR